MLTTNTWRLQLKTLSKTSVVRLFPEMQKKIDEFIDEYPGLWENNSSFCRSAVQHFITCPSGANARMKAFADRPPLEDSGDLTDLHGSTGQ